MFGFGKSAKSPSTDTPTAETGLFRRLISGLGRTREALGSGLARLVLGSKTLDADLLDQVETRLLTADVGMQVTTEVIAALQQQLNRRQLADPAQFLDALKSALVAQLAGCDAPLTVGASGSPFVILVVGVNGVGKTTTIGKLARRCRNQGQTVMLAAGDTFRAAAVEQLQAWGERNDVPVVAQGTGADSASVIFDAYQSAKARGVDVLIADTAGRLHTKSNLMQELEKIVRVLKKQDPNLPHETLLVVDATTGQNALNQAESFHRAVPLTGICITKLDGTAKGGMVFAIARKLRLPIRFIGIGEQADDLRPFDAEQFVAALFSE